MYPAPRFGVKCCTNENFNFLYFFGDLFLKMNIEMKFISTLSITIYGQFFPIKESIKMIIFLKKGESFYGLLLVMFIYLWREGIKLINFRRIS